MIRSSAILSLALIVLGAAPAPAAPVGDLGLNPAPLPTAIPLPGNSLGTLPILPEPLSRPGPKPSAWLEPPPAAPAVPMVSAASPPAKGPAASPPTKGPAASPPSGGTDETAALPVTPVQKSMWAASGVIVRSEPSARGKRVGSLDPGKRVEVTGATADGKWYQVARKGKVPGYVAANLLSETQPERPAGEAPAAALPEQRTELPPTRSHPAGRAVDILPDDQGRCPAGLSKLALTDGSPVCIKM